MRLVGKKASICTICQKRGAQFSTIAVFAFKVSMTLIS